MMTVQDKKRNLEQQFEVVKNYYPGLEIVSNSSSSNFTIVGNLVFHAKYSELEEIEDLYTLRIEIPWDFSASSPPRVYEIAGKIAPYYHHYISGCLCLGVPVAVKMCLLENCSLLGYIENLLIPYLYAHSFLSKMGKCLSDKRNIQMMNICFTIKNISKIFLLNAC